MKKTTGAVFLRIFFALNLLLALSSSAHAEASKELKFAKKEIVISLIRPSVPTTKIHLQVEVAQTPEQHERGLMFRKKLGDEEGMIFIFPDEQPRAFWMRNTFVPLSVGFFDQKKRLIDFFDMQPVKSEMETNPPSYQSSGPAQFVLEVPQGWFARKKIKIGDQLEIR